MAAMTISQELSSDIKISIKTIFKTNVGYIKTLRGGLNAGQMVLSLLSIGIMAYYCQFFIEPDRYIGFLCRHEDTCFLVICCINFVIATLVFICCTVSIDTTGLLSRALLPPASYLLCLLLTFGSSIALLCDVIRRNTPYDIKEEGFSGRIVAVVFGLLNCCLYGASLAVFWIRNK